MRPICLPLTLGLALCGCALVPKSSFTDTAQACLHMKETDVRARLQDPCKYAESLAMCFELPEPVAAKKS